MVLNNNYFIMQKLDGMPAVKLHQLQHESNTYKRVLSFMMDENIHLKNRLSTILKDRFNNNLLEDVEKFQNRFLKEDELIGLLRNDVSEMEKLFASEVSEEGEVIGEINHRIRKLRNNISHAEKDFLKLKVDFNSYMSENI